jgi:hypothetical protein
MKKGYYYEVEFYDGHSIRRENVTKKIATSIYHGLGYEMIHFGVKSVRWGVMQ